MADPKKIFNFIYLQYEKIALSHSTMSENIPEELAQYRIIREIGCGGFGVVFLAKDRNSEEFCALKVLSGTPAEVESEAFRKYAKISGTKQLMPILDSGVCGDFFYYAMPLADSLDGKIPPEDLRYEPKTLSAYIMRKLESSDEKWFDCGEILTIASAIFEAAATIGAEGLLHRDIKPDNIIFVGGEIFLSDFSLLRRDEKNITNAGTPYFSAPLWYLNSGGNPDVWGLGATFFALISGNPPELIGRAAYKFPQKTGVDFSKERWEHWQRCILRALAENPQDRFLTIEDFLGAILSDNFNSSAAAPCKTRAKKLNLRRPLKIAALAAALIALSIPAANFANKRLKAAAEVRGHIERLERINPLLAKAYKEGLTIENYETLDYDEIGTMRKKVQIMSYEKWRKDYLSRQKKYFEKVAQLEKLRAENAPESEISKLEFNIKLDEYFYECNTSISFEKYLTHIDMELNPHKYKF